MDTTVIVADLAARLRSAGGPDGLWVSAADALRIGGWELGPEGACQGSRCVPLPPGVVRDGLLDLAGLARHLGQPVVHDPTHDVWVIGESADALREGLGSLERTSRAAGTGSRTIEVPRSFSSPGRPGEGAASTCRAGRPSTPSSGS